MAIRNTWENIMAVEKSETVSVKEWIITTVILLIPFVNLVMPFVWAFSGNTNPSKANYFKAFILTTSLAVVLYFLFAGRVMNILYRAIFMGFLG